MEGYGGEGQGSGMCMDQVVQGGTSADIDPVCEHGQVGPEEEEEQESPGAAGGAVEKQAEQKNTGAFEAQQNCGLREHGGTGLSLRRLAVPVRRSRSKEESKGAAGRSGGTASGRRRAEGAIPRMTAIRLAAISSNWAAPGVASVAKGLANCGLSPAWS
jgi:hypothetical protein